MEEERRHTVPIILALVTAIAPHAPGLPLWINVWCLALWGYVVIRLTTGWPMPGVIFRHILALAGLAGLVLTFKTRLDSDTFVGLMAVMAAVKPFETVTHRHRMITVLLTYFIIITSLFRSDSLWILLYMFVSVLVTTIALIRINDLTGRLRSSIRLACRIMGQALPLMILLFFLFPRLPDGMFGMKEIRRGMTGFSEQLTPGSISSLAMDDAIAFRVRFDTEDLPDGGLYWRGIVFERFNGKSWLPAAEPRLRETPASGPEGGFPHTVILEPHQSRWLFGLDVPVQAPENAELTRSYTVRSRWKIRRKTTYRMVSGSGPAPDQTPLISLDPDSNPETRNLARKLAGHIPDPQEKIRTILNYFQTTGFAYTLSPGKTPSLDEFLLKTRRGYCEHYASALAFMMNVVGVPSRVVGGYLGGELNPFARLMTIRRSSAHAWTEIFVPDKGWIRVDPTLVLSPERIFQNPDGSPARASLDRISAIGKLRYWMESINIQWEAWFTGFSHETQKAILQGLRSAMDSGRVMFLSLAATVMALFALFLVRIRVSCSRSRDPVKKAYEKFCRRLVRAGLPPKRRDQGPVDYAKKINEKRPDLKSEVDCITDLYIGIRFRRNGPKDGASRLKKQVQGFKPGPARKNGSSP